MEWTRAIDAYCERTDPSFWSEPINAITNLAFMVSAIIMWRRTNGLLLGRGLAVILFAIGLGSSLLHTFGTVWAAMTDVIPIVLFIMVYIYAANRTYWDLAPWSSMAVTVLFVPYAAVGTFLMSRLPFFSISAEYWPVPVLILIYAWLLATRLPEVSRGLLLGAGLLVVSLALRSLDEIVCGVLPLGTHFAWHLLNAVMLGWMIEVWRRAASVQPTTS